MSWVIAIVVILFFLFKGVNRISIAIFGRKSTMTAKLTVPPELSSVSRPTMWPDIKNDREVRRLSSLYTNSIPVISSWPKWQPLWLHESDGCNKATLEEIEVLFHPLFFPKLPYEIVDQVPEFTSIGAEIVNQGPPPEPLLVPESYPSPVLSLPYWAAPLSFFNKHVEAAHADLISTHRRLLQKQSELKESAQTINTARRKAWENACQRYNIRLDFYIKREAAKVSFEQARDADITRMRRVRNLITEKDMRG